MTDNSGDDFEDSNVQNSASEESSEPERQTPLKAGDVNMMTKRRYMYTLMCVALDLN